MANPGDHYPIDQLSIPSLHNGSRNHMADWCCKFDNNYCMCLCKQLLDVYSSSGDNDFSNLQDLYGDNELLGQYSMPIFDGKGQY